MANHETSPVFVVGHPRSGTTWLTGLLGRHPRLASGSETHLFDLYLKPLLEQRSRWLRGWVDDEALDGLIRELVQGVFRSKLTRTGKARVVEKTPTHRHYLGHILRLFPNAKIVHCIRDGRDVALSLLVMRFEYGKRWAPATLEACAESWKQSIEVMEQWREQIGRERLVEIKYEDLVRRTAASLSALLDRIGESVTSEDLDAMMSAYPAESQSLGKWRHELRCEQHESFLRIAGDTLTNLGYLT